MTKTNKIFIIIVGLLVVGLFTYSSLKQKVGPDYAEIEQEQITSEDQTAAPDNITIYYSIENIGEQELQIVSGQTVLEALKEYAEFYSDLTYEIKSYEGLGDLVVRIGDFENGADNNYWQYYINGEMPQVGADNYVLNDQDRVEWKFTTSEY